MSIPNPSSSQAKEQDDDTKPLRKYLTKIRSGCCSCGGKYEIKCKLHETFSGPIPKGHLLKISEKGVRVCQK